MAKQKKRTAPAKVVPIKEHVGGPPPQGEHVRKLAPAASVRSVINEIIVTKNTTSEAGQELSTATKRFADKGGNVPAVRIAARLYSKAKQDSLKARVLWEDVCYYLECTDFERIAPAGMFTPDEGGQRHDEQEQPLAKLVGEPEQEEVRESA